MNWVELLDGAEYVKLFAGLLAMVDPFGAIPVYLGLTKDCSAKEKRQIGMVATFAFFCILVTFTFFGEAILGIFGIKIGAFQIAGGILLLLMALEMMNQKAIVPDDDDGQHSTKASLGIVPMALPLLAGPGAISTVIIYSHRHESIEYDFLITSVILVLAVCIFICLRLAPIIAGTLGKTGMAIFHRVMGLIIAAVGIEFILDGLMLHFPQLVQ
jgi:multiple antibiotic resistance protein